MYELIIRNVREDDFLAIAELAEKCPPMVTERNSIYHIFTRFFSETSFIAEDDGAAGFILGFISQSDPSEAYIHLLCTAPSHRGTGLADELLQTFIDTVKSRGAGKVLLITKPVNQRAIRFYLRNGFRHVESCRMVESGPVRAIADYNGPGEDMVLFRRFI